MKFNRYHKKFINSFSSENIIGLFSRYKNAHKEITESWAMLEAAKKAVENIDSCIVVIVGDGASPRTGAIFAYYTKAEVVSIDPNFNLDHWEEHFQKQRKMGFEPKRLQLIKNSMEVFEFDCKNMECIIIWPHSHAHMNSGNIYNYSTRIDIAMPCCVPIPPNWMSQPHTIYTDYNVLSPKRDIHIWIKTEGHEK